MHRSSVCGIFRHVLSVAFALSVPLTAAAQQPQNPPPDPPSAGPQSDFLFGRPHGSIAVRGAWIFSRAGSDLFDFVTRELTLDKKDFNAPGFALDVAIAIKPRLDVIIGTDINRTTKRSEYRDFVDNNFLPIEQRTTLKTAQIGGSLRYALTPRGTDVSRYAWVPRRVVPFVGAGGGAIFYEFSQSGDFVDFVDLSVFPDFFRSKGWAPSAHAFGGVDLQLYRALYGTIEGRYVWGSAELSRDFVDFDPIDLAGFRLSAGINLLF